MQLAEVLLQQVCKSYDGRTFAVSDLDLTCPKGKMLAGIELVTPGRILFDGIDVTTLSSLARNVAIVFEDYSHYLPMSLIENMAFPLRVRGMSAAEIRRKVDVVIELLGLRARLDASVGSRSVGAQHKKQWKKHGNKSKQTAAAGR